MRNLSSLFTCFSVIFLLASCTKTDFQPTGQGSNDVIGANVTASGWMSDAAILWEDAGTTDLAKQYAWSVPEITENMVNRHEVIVYAKNEVDGTVQEMPIAIYDQANGVDHDDYQLQIAQGSIALVHTKTVNGNFEIPVDANNVSFRYLLVPSDEPSSNARINTNSITVDQLRMMTYDEVVNMLGIER